MRRLMLGMAIAAIAALLPATSHADDQQIAEFIKSRLQVEQQQGNLRGFNVDMRVDRGTVWFKGQVSTPEQETLILRTAQQAGYLGVVQVVDDIEVSPALSSQTAPIQAPAQAPVQAPALAPIVTPQAQMPYPAVRTPMESEQQRMDEQYQRASYQESTQQYAAPPTAPERIAATQMPIATGNVYSSGAPLPFAQAGGQGGNVPSFQASAPRNQEFMGTVSGGYDPGMGQPMAGGLGTPVPTHVGGGGGVSGTPNLPGYAWPGYAASPNYAAVSYPKQYSASAWPYIGPFYPYPQVPLGWRKVQLEWDDGWWFLDFKDH